MELQHINVKIFVDGTLSVEPARFINVFHEWVKDRVMDELLIDVADYRHVPAGPGVLLAGHEADYSMDNTDDRWGLRYNRKAPLDGSNDDRLRQALRAAVNASMKLEGHFANDGPLKFNRQEFELFINDRALAPNTTETFTACKPLIDSFLSGVLGHNDFTLEHQDNPRRRFGMLIKLAKPVDWSQVLTSL